MPAPRATVSASPGGSPAALGLRILDTPSGVPARAFRDVLYLRFAAAADGLAEEIAVIAEATVLRAKLEPRDYDALQPGTPLSPAALHATDGALVVELEAPRRLLFIQLAPQPAPVPGYSLLVHRLDGEAMSEKPTATSRSISTDSLFDFTNLRFMDARFALRLEDPDGRGVPLTAADLIALRVRADATGARIGIAALPDPAQPGADPFTSPTLVWPPPGDAFRAPSGDIDAGQALSGVVSRHLAGLLAPLPAAVDVALVIAADAPCQVELQALEIPYRLVRRSLASGAEKEVMRFSGPGAADRPVVLRLPGGATVTTALLETLPSLRGDHLVLAAAAEPWAEPAEQRGVLIDGRSRVAQRLTPPRAVVATGVAVGILTLAGGTELAVELREDHDGAPAGRQLAQGTLRLAAAGRRLWTALVFPAPVILPAQPVWLLLTAAHGEAVWLTRRGAVPGAATLRLLGPSEAPGDRHGEVDDLETLHQLLAAGEDQAAPPAPQVLVAGTPVPAVAGSGNGDGKTAYQLAGALNRRLAGAAAGPTEVALTFTSAVPGLLTVYPPRIEYEPRLPETLDPVGSPLSG